MQSIRGKFIAFRNDRLGARINVLINAMRLSADYGIPFAMNWPSHESVSEELQNPDELFTQTFLEEHFFDDIGFAEIHRNAVSVTDLRPDETPETLQGRAAAGQAFLCNDALNISVLPWEDREAVAAKLPQTVRDIDVTDTVADAMQRIDARLGSVDLVAYHLRRGDIIDTGKRASNVLWPSKYVPRVFYETHIRKLLARNPETRIVFFSDTPGEVAAFSAMRENVLSFDDLVGALDLTLLQRDFLELFAMSRCATIYAPSASAFSAVAATMGNGTIVPILDDLTDDDRIAALDELSDRMARTPDVFLGPADLGQNIPFLLNHHRDRNSRSTARAVLTKMMDEGFERAYLYDALAEELFDAGDWDGMQRLLETLRTRPIHTEEANALTYVYAGMCALETGEIAAATRLAQTANWLTPIHPLSRALSNVLMGHDLFDAAKAFPIDRRMIGLRNLMKDTDKVLFDRLNKAAARVSGVDVETGKTPWLAFQHDLRDWTDLQGAKLPPSFFNREKLGKLIGFYRAGLAKSADKPHIRAGLSTLLRQQGDLEGAREEILAALSDEPDQPLFHKRLADLHLAEGKPRHALVALEEALAHAPGTLCYRAQLGLALFETGDTSAAQSMFEVLGSKHHDLPEVALVTADILRRRKKSRDLALEVVRRATAQVHGASRLMKLEAKILEQMGRADEGAAIRSKLKSWARPASGFSSRVRKIAAPSDSMAKS